MNKKLNTELITKIMGLYAVGVPKKAIIGLCELNPKTMERWLRRTRQDPELFPDEDPLIWELRDAIALGQGQVIEKNLRNVQDAADNGDAKAAQWMLEKLDKETFGKVPEADTGPNKVIIVPAIAGSVAEWQQQHVIEVDEVVPEIEQQDEA